jgi:dihydrofolate reductase
MKIIAIAAIDQRGAIGYNNDILFRDKRDMKHFAETTKGGVCLWGRKTFDAVGQLPGRANIVLTRKKDRSSNETTLYVQSIGEALKRAENGDVARLYVCGGAEIYAMTKNLWNELYLTIFDALAPNADSFFPQWYDASYQSKIILSEPGLNIIHYTKLKQNA